jgi:hypothetical protein
VGNLDGADAYAYDPTFARTGTTQSGVQHPGYDFRLQGNGDLPLTEVDRASAVVIFPDEIAGVITVLQLPDETPVAEVAKRAGEPARLGLLPGRYRLRLRDDSGVREALIGLDAGAELHARGFEARDADIAASKGPDSSGAARIDRPAGDAYWATAVSVFPGAGQVFNHQWGKGVVFLGATIAAGGTIWGPGNFSALASSGGAGSAVPLMIWGWAIADAANGATPGGMHRPVRGWTVAVGTSSYMETWTGRSAAFEWYPSSRFSVGVSDLGVANAQDDPHAIAYTGALRGMVILSRGRHWQPAVVGVAGIAVEPSREVVSDQMEDTPGSWEADQLEREPDLDPPAGSQTLAMLGGAFDLRYYGTPRYFLELEVGGRSIDDEMVPSVKLGLGVHFGR